MQWLNSNRMRLVVVGVVAAIVLCGGSAKADFTFGEPVNLEPTVNSPVADYPDCLSADGLELYLESDRSPKQGGWDIWVAKRETIDDEWGSPMNLGPKINGPTHDGCASISVDGLELYFSSLNRAGGHGGSDIWVSRRQTKDGDWGDAVNLGPIVNSSFKDGAPWISTDSLELYFDSDRSGGFGSWDIWVSRRATKNDPWGEPTNIGSVVNSSDDLGYPSLSSDGLLLLCSDETLLHPGGFGRSDIWMSKRKTITDPWGELMNLGPRVNGPRWEESARLSPDGLTLYLCRPGPTYMGGGRSDIWQAAIIPIVDFNIDGIVNAADMCIMVNHWGEDYPLCDIGPMPWGDGIVDVQDLIVLSEHLFEDYRLIAHWELNEEAGDTANDSVGEYDGTLHGEPIWQPEDGIVDGTLQFDGIDDYVSTPFVLNPGKVSFSVTAWIRGGATNQVIISQADTPTARTIEPGSTWLGINPSDGRLMTGLMDISFGPLESESVITDGQWHHVGLVYDLDSLCRCLYVDGAEVARDAAPVAGIPSEGGLYFGAGKNLDARTFFSGLIDDIRIYNAALSAEEVEALAQ